MYLEEPPPMYFSYVSRERTKSIAPTAKYEGAFASRKKDPNNVENIINIVHALLHLLPNSIYITLLIV